MVRYSVQITININNGRKTDIHHQIRNNRFERESVLTDNKGLNRERERERERERLTFAHIWDKLPSILVWERERDHCTTSMPCVELV